VAGLSLWLTDCPLLAHTHTLSSAKVLVLWLFTPDQFTAEEFSLIIGDECTNVIGASSSVGMPRATQTCIAVYINVRSSQQLREFVDLYVGTMLFFVYTIHTSLAYVRSDMYKGVGKAVFCVCVLLEAAFTQELYWRFYRFEKAFDDAAVIPSNNLLSPEFNDPFYTLITNIIYESTAVRSGALLVLLVTFAAADTGLACAGLPSSRLCSNRVMGKRVMRLLHKLYALCFVVLCSLCGFVVLQFYRVKTYSSEVRPNLI
jgi:hypothetical protein